MEAATFVGSFEGDGGPVNVEVAGLAPGAFTGEYCCCSVENPGLDLGVCAPVFSVDTARPCPVLVPTLAASLDGGLDVLFSWSREGGRTVRDTF